MRIYLSLILCLLVTSCKYFNFTKENKNDIIENHLKEIKKNGLEHYPQIFPCDELTAKTCFETQLGNELKNGLKEIPESILIKAKDTLWMSININNKGELSLKKIALTTNKEIEQNIKETLAYISPIKPAIIRGAAVNCSFKIPLVLKISN